ncbi:MAG: hypothetical protein ACE5KM_12275 [Planctomycetaceae bacterium]
MRFVLDAASGLALIAAAYCLWRGRRALRGTEMMTAWSAAVLSVALGGGVCVLTRGQLVPTGVHGHLWYGVAVLFLTPLICVLGARKPISRVWPWFVVLPMIGGLEIPTLATLWRAGADAPLRLETPTLVGFGLVLAMGAGNYLITPFRLAAALYAAGVALLVVPGTDAGLDGPAQMPASLGLSAVCLSLVVVFVQATRSGRRSRAPHQRRWADFRDTFGGVWAKRVMDRINWTAREEGWPARMEFAGLVWTDDDVADDDRRKTLQRLQQLDRWLLKRFVDDAWLNARCENGEST